MALASRMNGSAGTWAWSESAVKRMTAPAAATLPGTPPAPKSPVTVASPEEVEDERATCSPPYAAKNPGLAGNLRAHLRK